jgi:predicted permease
MASVLLALGLIAGIGSVLRYLLPDLDGELARRTIGTLVLNVFLPALVFRVITTASLGPETLQIPLVMLLAILLCLAAATLAFRPFRLPPQEKGALILASAFGNVTYLGLPVLQGLFPALSLEVAKVAILSEVTTTPLNLSLGTALGTQFGGGGGGGQRAPLWRSALGIVQQVGLEMLRLPALWAVAVGMIWKLSGVPVPAVLLQATGILGNAVTGLMMLALGLGLRYRPIQRPLPLLLASAIKLLLSPLLVFGLARWVGVQAPYFEALVLEGAMPSQLLTFVIADRVGLNAERLALCILLNTAASFLTIPLIRTLLVGG